MEHSTDCGGSLVGALISHSRFLEELGWAALAPEQGLIWGRKSQGPGAVSKCREQDKPAACPEQTSSANLQSAHSRPAWNVWADTEGRQESMDSKYRGNQPLPQDIVHWDKRHRIPLKGPTQLEYLTPRRRMAPGL